MENAARFVIDIPLTLSAQGGRGALDAAKLALRAAEVQIALAHAAQFCVEMEALFTRCPRLLSCGSIKNTMDKPSPSLFELPGFGEQVDHDSLAAAFSHQAETERRARRGEKGEFVRLTPPTPDPAKMAPFLPGFGMTSQEAADAHEQGQALWAELRSHVPATLRGELPLAQALRSQSEWRAERSDASGIARQLGLAEIAALFEAAALRRDAPSASPAATRKTSL